MFRHDLVELVTLDPTIRCDVRYATEDNFLGEAVYPSARCFLLAEAAEDLLRVQADLEPEGLGLLVFDGYRPWSVTRTFWDRVSAEERLYVADPVTGSKHNRGAAVDLTLCRLDDGEPLPMPSGFDEFTERAWAAYAGGTEEERAHRTRLITAMEAHGFTVNPHEWWHFDHHSFPRHPVLDVSFEELAASVGASAP